MTSCVLKAMLRRPHGDGFGRYQDREGQAATVAVQRRAEAVKREATLLHVLLSASNGNVHPMFKRLPETVDSRWKDRQYKWLLDRAPSIEHSWGWNSWGWWRKDVTQLSPNLYVPFMAALYALTLIPDMQARDASIMLGGPFAGHK